MNDGIQTSYMKTSTLETGWLSNLSLVSNTRCLTVSAFCAADCGQEKRSGEVALVTHASVCI